MYDYTDGNDLSLDFDSMCNGMDFAADADNNLDIYDDIDVKMSASDRLEAEEDMAA